MNPDIILLGVTLLATVASLVWLVIKMLQALDSTSWPRVDCEITTSLAKRRPWDEEFYQVIVEYQYTYEGKQYHGNTIRMGVTSLVGAWSSNPVLRRYHRGRITKVSVNPSRPEQSVLEPGHMTGLCLQALFSAVLLVWLVWVLIHLSP